MVEMFEKEHIRKKHFIEGWSIREISRSFKLSRQTVRKMLKDAEAPRYNRQQPKPCPVMDPYRAFLENIIEQDKFAPVKQRHTAARIYERLCDEFGFTGGESTVRHYLRKLKAVPNECFLVLEAAPGEQMQIDFGHAEVLIAGKRVKACLFCMRLKYSSVPFVVAFPTERLEAFLEGHVRGFAYFGGIPKEGLYDNATTQVVKVLEGPDREEHQVFSSFRAHYLFNSLFCRPATGSDKGSVESLVKHVRSRALVPVPSFADWDELNAHLLNWCEKEKHKHQEKWQTEERALRPLPAGEFSTAQPRPVKISRYALATVDRNQYSVPCQYTGLMLLAKAYVDRVEVIHGSEIVATHPRCYSRGHVQLDMMHYLTALERKPHAVTHASVVRQLPEVFGRLREQMVQAHSRGYKDFLAVLLLLREHAITEVAAAIEAENGAPITASVLKHRLSSAVQVDLKVTDVVTTTSDAARYDLLLPERKEGVA